MSRLSVIVLVFVIGFSGSVAAQSSDQRGVCKADYDKYCAGVAPGGGRVVACLNQQRAQLSDACKKAIDGRKAQ